MIPKILRQKEVTVLVIVINRYLKFFRLNTAFRGYGLRAGLLLCQQCIHSQLTKLQIRLHTEQGRTTVYQRVTSGHTDISGFDRFDNLIFFTGIS